MAKTAFIIGSNGQIGRALALELLEHGWRVRVAHRGSRPLPSDMLQAGAEEVVCDRHNAGSLQAAVGPGADLVVDCVAYHAEDGHQLVELSSVVGSIAVVSSASVYCDDAGRTLDEAGQHGFPTFSGLISEEQATVAPGPQTYSTNKVAMERVLLDEAKVPVTILRPCAIYGPGSRHPREWWFVKRALEGRRRVPLAFCGESRFHTTAAATIAQVCRTSAEARGTRIVNVGDPDPPTVKHIADVIGSYLQHSWELVPLPGKPHGTVGRTPWSVPCPFLLDTSKARKLCGAQGATYQQQVASTCEDLLQSGAQQDWQSAFPVLAKYPYDLFDYSSEDRWLSRL